MSKQDGIRHQALPSGFQWGVGYIHGECIMDGAGENPVSYFE
jgi:hypothetical protein